MLDNKNIKVYTIYNDDNTIKERYVRKPSSLDSHEVITSKFYPIAPSQNKPNDTTLPTFFGEWEKVPQDEIDKLNEIILSKGKTVKTRKSKSLTYYNEQRQLKIKQAKELLEALQAELENRTKEKEVK